MCAGVSFPCLVWVRILEVMSTNKKSGRKPDPSSKRSQGVDRHVSPRIVFHADPDDYEALLEHLKESSVELKVSSVMRRAMRLYLESVGKAPPKKKE